MRTARLYTVVAADGMNGNMRKSQHKHMRCLLSAVKIAQVGKRRVYMVRLRFLTVITDGFELMALNFNGKRPIQRHERET